MMRMNPGVSITDIISSGQVVGVERDVSDPKALLARLTAWLQEVKPHSSVALVTAPEGSFAPLAQTEAHRTRLFFSTVDDPTVEVAQRYLERLMPERIELPDPAILAQLYRNVQLRVAFLSEQETWTPADVARFAGSRARNVSATAARWRADGLVFAIEHEGQLRYPAFQFDLDERRPKEIVADILAVFRSHEASDWEIALWFTSIQPALGAAPATALDSAPAAVLDAAQATYVTPT